MERILAIFGALALFALAILAAPFWSAADTVTSTDFTIKDAYIGPFGGYATSTSFRVANGGAPIMNGNATSASFTSATGPVNSTDFSPKSEVWRWYGDANDETPTSSLAAENTAPSNIAAVTPIKLRLTIKETSGLAGSANVKFHLQFSTASDFSSQVGTVQEISLCTATSSWCYAAGAGADNSIISTKVLSDADACSAGAGSGCGTHNTSGTSLSTSTQAKSAATEYEFTVESSGAAVGTTYFFRAMNPDGSGVPLNGTSSYPSLVTQGATLTFSVSGLPQGTSTNGIVTSIATTPTSVSFGTLPFGSSLMAAQRLSATTDATAGYEIYVLQDAPLTDTLGHQVPSLGATNASPASWSSACTATSTACYGYHAGSSVLSGGSTRFAANDSYAGLSSSPAEVGYSSVATTSSTMDMVYRIQANPTQGNGSYASNLIYIVAPIF